MTFHNLFVHAPKHKSRRWQRLSLAFPVFVHSTDEEGKPVLEFGTALNVSAGGVLVAVKRVPRGKDVVLEMPVPPGFPSGAPTSFRTIEGTVVRTEHSNQHTYLGLEFKRPLPPV